MRETADSECTKKDHEQLVDRISQLSDDVLVHMLSFLTLGDAVRTSVLSKRWIDLWMFVTRLNFDTSKGLNSISIYASLRTINRVQYVKFVNKVLQSHKAMVLDEFRIRFDLGKSSQDDIDKWIQYALTRKVQRLDLDLSKYNSNTSKYNSYTRGGEDYYAFPRDLLGLGNGYSSAASVCGYSGNGINSGALVGCKTIRDLTLKNVNVSGEVLESLLRNCPFLECLVVVGNPYLSKFHVCGPNLALKHLEIMHCTKLHLTVCNTNIVSLKTNGGGRMVVKNVPMLADVNVDDPWSMNLDDLWSMNLIPNDISWFSCCQSTLEFLTLQVPDPVILTDGSDVALPQLTKLKQLTLVVHASLDDSLIPFTSSLVRASPNLEKFVLKTKWGPRDDIQRIGRESKKAFPLKHLKIVELCGYFGRPTEVEFVEYLLENAVALERIIVEPRAPFFGSRSKQERIVGTPFFGSRSKQERIVGRFARKQLEGLVPSHVELVIV